MVSKLSFKGDKPSSVKKKKQSKKTSLSSTLKKQIIQDSQQQQPPPSWIVPSNLSQLKGPIILQLSSSDQGRKAELMSITQDNKLSITTGTDNGSQIIEPQQVQQVFILVPLPSSSSSSNNNNNRDKKDQLPVALKTWDDGYLTVANKESGEVSVSHGAISKAQGFCIVNSGPDDHDNDHGHRQLKVSLQWQGLTLSRGMRFTSDPTSELVTLTPRIQFKSLATTVIKQGAAKTSNYDLEQAVNELIKSGIEVDDKVMGRLSDFKKQGRLNEGVVLIKEGKRSDSRC